MIDCELEFRNGDIKYGTLLTDNGGIYGLTSDGIISPQQTVKYYFAFTIVDGLNIKNNDFSLNSRITITFMEGLKEKPKYNHADCDYRYEIKIN